MNKKELEEFAVMKNEITHINDNVSELKNLLKEHIEWEETRHQELESKFANKWTEKVIVGIVVAVASGIALAIINFL